MNNPPSTLIILPTYNEADNLRPMAERLLAMKPALEVLVVDDNSPDGTGNIADSLANLPLPAGEGRGEGERKIVTRTCSL